MTSPDARKLMRGIRKRLAPVGNASECLVHYDLALAHLDMGLHRDRLDELTLYVAHPVGPPEAEVQALLADLRTVLL